MSEAANAPAPRSAIKGWRLGCVTFSLLFCCTATVAAALIGWYVVGSIFEDPPPRLPEFAYPQSGVKTNEFKTDCGGGPGGLPCRRLVFHSVNDFGESQRALIGEFDRRGWTFRDYRAGEDGQSYVLFAESRPDDICIDYLSYMEPATVEGMQRPFVVNVSVERCSDVQY